MNRMIDNDKVDKEHCIEFPELNATLFFLKESEKNGIKTADLVKQGDKVYKCSEFAEEIIKNL